MKPSFLSERAGAAVERGGRGEGRGYGGVAAAARVTKVARSTIGRGLKDLRDLASLTGEVRRKGGGSPRLTTRDPTLLEHLQRLLEPATNGRSDAALAMGVQEPRQAGDGAS